MKQKRVKTLEEFILEANKVQNAQGRFFDYSQTVYLGKKEDKVKVICPKHGAFEQMARSHLKGSGCRKCATEFTKSITRKTIEKFVKEAKDVHGAKYGYELVDYQDATTKVQIRCDTHGYFEQTPDNHLSGRGCKRCAIDVLTITQAKGKEKFIEDAKIIHGSLYDYQLVDYVNSSTKIKIICEVHGIFEQAPSNHLSGKGCRKCGSKRSANLKFSNTQEFIHKAQKIWGDDYDYSLSQYERAIKKLIVICKVHGQFSITPNDHLCGQGCPKCSIRTSYMEQKWLEILGIPESCWQKVIKVGERKFVVDALDPITNTIYEFYGDYWHGNPLVFDPLQINDANKKTFGELHQKTIEKENVLRSAGYHLTTIWETDFVKLVGKKKARRPIISKPAQSQKSF